jgi:hypothetical protein
MTKKIERKLTHKMLVVYLSIPTDYLCSIALDCSYLFRRMYLRRIQVVYLAERPHLKTSIKDERIDRPN